MLESMGFDFDRADEQAVRRLGVSGYRVVALVGGASAGKSTIFNTLIRKAASVVSAHAHETVGAIVACPSTDATSFLEASGMRVTMLEGATVGEHDAIHMTTHTLDADLILVDTPDLTSLMSLEEGSLTATLMPWFDVVVLVLDEERWHDDAVLDHASRAVARFGATRVVVCNCTESMEITPDMRAALEQRLGPVLISPFDPTGEPRAIRDALMERFVADDSREQTMRASLAEKASRIVATNVHRLEAHSRLQSQVNALLDEIIEDTQITMDLLTHDERQLLGLPRRFVPFQALLKRRKGIDFEKRSEHLAQTLEENHRTRFSGATARIDTLVAGCAPGASMSWQTPELDAETWARRIRSQIDAWREERESKSSRSDMAALGVGVPLLVADLLFLGGLGMTVGWTAAAVAGFFGAKGLAGVLDRSPAFRQYQTTVRAYQASLREALDLQWQANLRDLPRRHLSMQDPILRALMRLEEG